jgi:hypothetical protein
MLRQKAAATTQPGSHTHAWGGARFLGHEEQGPREQKDSSQLPAACRGTTGNVKEERRGWYAVRRLRTFLLGRSGQGTPLIASLWSPTCFTMRPTSDALSPHSQSTLWTRGFAQQKLSTAPSPHTLGPIPKSQVTKSQRQSHRW